MHVRSFDELNRVYNHYIRQTQSFYNVSAHQMPVDLGKQVQNKHAVCICSHTTNCWLLTTELLLEVKEDFKSLLVIVRIQL